MDRFRLESHTPDREVISPRRDVRKPECAMGAFRLYEIKRLARRFISQRANRRARRIGSDP